MQQLLSSLEDERQRQFRRFVGISAGAHVVLALLFWIGPIRPSAKNLVVVERVMLVPTLPAPAPARPAPPKPAPAPAKPKPPPPLAKKVLPKQPAPVAKPRPPEAKPAQAKPKPKAEPKEPEAVAEESYEELMERLHMEEILDAASKPAARPAEQVAAAVGPAGGPGIVDPELARWIKEVKIQVTRAWIVAPNFQRQPLETVLAVEVGATGDVQSVRVTQSSGNPWYDENVERALQKSSPLPAPPRADVYEFSFRPDELQ